MPIKGEQQGYTYKALIDGVWQEITIQESPLELLDLMERYEQDEEWTRVRHGRWVEHHEPYTWMGYTYWSCSECGFECGYGKDILHITDYCPNCGAKMDEREEDGNN